MLIIHADRMYNSEVSIQQSDGKYNLTDDRSNVLFSSTKIAHTNKALQYVTEQDAKGNGILVDQIAAAVFAASVIINPDVYGPELNALTQAFVARGIQPGFLTAQELIDEPGKVEELESANEYDNSRDIEERIAIGYVKELLPEDYELLDYSDLADYLGIPVSELPEREERHEERRETLEKDSKREEPEEKKQSQMKYQIETKNRSFETPSISMTDKPNRKGYYFINDADGKGFYSSKNKGTIEKLFVYVNEKAAAGEVISTKELKRLEFQSAPEKENEKNAGEQPSDIKDEYDQIKHDIKNVESLEKRLSVERQKVLEQIEIMKQNQAPVEIIELAERICKHADEQGSRTAKTSSVQEEGLGRDIAADAASKDRVNSYITYRLENRLLTRANASFKAGVMTAYDALREPLRKLREFSLAREAHNRAKEALKIQHRLERYQKKLSPKMPKRLEHANKMRRRNGLQPLPADTPIYTAVEQEKINSLKLMIESKNQCLDLLKQEIEKSTEGHLARLNYVKEQKAISHNEKITEKHKKVMLQHMPVQEPNTEHEKGQQPKKEHENNHPSTPVPTPEATATEQASCVPPVSNDAPEGNTVTIPVYDPEGNVIGEQTIEAEPTLDEGGYFPNPEAMGVGPDEGHSERATREEPVFEPLEARFSKARQESEVNKNQLNAKLVFSAISRNLPANGFIEFEANGNAYTAQKDEFGELTMKRHNYETGLNETISHIQAINDFMKAPKEFENAVKEQLGGVLSNEKSRSGKAPEK